MKALITGASSGIGRDIARILSNKGYELILVARNKKRLLNLKKELKTKSKIILMDLSNIENCKKLYNQEKDIDLLVNNAAVGYYGYFSNIDLDKQLQEINTNIISYHVLMRLYLKDMIEKDSGKILNVASLVGFMPGPLSATYNSTKAYIVRISEAIREEIKNLNSKVQISILCPGPVKTNFFKSSNLQVNNKGADSMEIAKYAVKELEKGKFYIIPGFNIKIAKYFGHLLPDKLLAKICIKSQERKYKIKKDG